MTGEYAIAVHALVFLSHKGECINSEALAENVCTNPARIRKIMAKLKRAGLVETKEGAEGGYRFCTDPKKADLASVLGAVGEEAVPQLWHSGDPCADCFVSSGMADIMDGVTGELDLLCKERLSKITIADINEKIFGQR